MRLQLTAAIVGCFALTGCFDLKQDFRFNADKTADVEFRIAMDAALLALAEKNPEKPFCSNDMIEKDGITGTATATTEGGDSVCTVVMSGTIDSVVEALADANLSEDAEQQGIVLSRSGDNYTLLIEVPALQKPNTTDDNPMAETMHAMMLAKMSGRALSWSVTAPSIVDTNGRLSDDGTTASYSRPLAEAFTSNEPTRFNVTFSLEQPGYLDRLKALFQ